MFEPGTILALREPQSTETKSYPYDRVEVVGQSPVQHATSSGTPWAGPDAVGYILRPAGETFGPTIDKPYGELNALYEVEAWPTDPTTGDPITPQSNPRNAPSPEQQFARIAREQEAAAPTRPKAPALQHNHKTPEQVLREANTIKPKVKNKPNES